MDIWGIVEISPKFIPPKILSPQLMVNNVHDFAWTIFALLFAQPRFWKFSKKIFELGIKKTFYNIGYGGLKKYW